MDVRLAGFMDAAQKVVDDFYTNPNRYGGAIEPPKLEATRGPKWTRIAAHRSNGDVSAWAFVNNETGAIHKPASWKRPAKHARGHIGDSDFGAHCLTAYGPFYLRCGVGYGAPKRP